MRLPILQAICLVSTALAADQAPGPVEFRTHVIESKMPGGYAVIVVDVNKDGKPDVIGMTQRVPDLAWYENPTWERHVMIRDMKSMVNLAAADIDGDGIPEVAIQSEFSMNAAQSPGLVWLLRHQ